MKIISDSSCDIITLENANFCTVPFKISTNIHEFTDDCFLDVKDMVNTLAGHKGRSFTGCPGIQDWLDAFGSEKEIYVCTLTSALSGSYSSARTAAIQYMDEHPDANVYVFDTLSAGPEVLLLVDKINELTKSGLSFEDVCREASRYLETTRLFFSLESLHNLAQNGRVSKITASAAGLLGIRILGTASKEGTLEQITKCRGEQKLIPKLMNELKKAGYKGGKLYIAHVFNPNFANIIKKSVIDQYPDANVKLYECRGLCSFYAENGGILIGCEC
ncbi:MAG: DegV family EDD domain-containing protein [Lachnospiraceae bacterium]|nr:DegV family EDD domain-containing protein [Lachnospiraceae bacterium]